MNNGPMLIQHTTIDRWLAIAARLVLASLWLAFAHLALAQDFSGTFTKGPYLQAPGTNTITIMWESPVDSRGMVHFGLDSRLNSQALALPAHTFKHVTAGNKAAQTKLSHLYQVTLENLSPASVYAYSIELNGLRTRPRKFKTLGCAQDKITFVAYGDSRSQPAIHAAVAWRFKGHSPDFILHLGDLVAKGKQYDLWSKEFFTPLAQVINEVPLFATIGNHEEDGTNYLHYFHFPGNERWYSFDAGPVHVLTLDYHFDKASHEQYRFASNDLRATSAPWKIVVLHYPVFNIGGHQTAWGHETYLPLFRKHRVDLVLTGHSHVYERFRPLRPRDAKEAWPITHITTGGGGAGLAVSYPHPAILTRGAIHHFMVFEATCDSLSGRTINSTGHVIDAFELKKNDGQPARDYLAQVYPEEGLKLSYDVSLSLTGTVAALPTSTIPAQVTLNIHPVKHSSQPVELEISMAPDSVPYYRLVGAPLRITTPAPNASNKVLTALVQATGKKKVTGNKGQAISPGLAFQARVKADWIETLAYGQKCRLAQTKRQ
jgi:predicted phosphodiesterase